MWNRLAFALALLLTLLTVGANAASAHSTGPALRKPVVAPSAPSARAAVAVRFALGQVGKPYAWGAAGPRAYDCSGLIQTAYRAAGIRLPRVSSAQKAAGRRVPLSQMRPGDIVAYPGHVTLYVGGGKQVAARKAGTRIAVQPVYRGAQFGVRVA